MLKKCLSIMIAAVMLICMTVVPTVQADTTSKTIIVHYNRPANDYDGWNLWMWPDGGEGKSIKFTDDDSFGKVALYSVPKTTSKAGIIVRLNDWEAKDIESDRFIDTSADVTEVWINSGKADILTTAPAGAEKYDYEKALAERSEVKIDENQVKLNLHYHRYNMEDYDNGWNIWLWEPDKDGAAYDFTSKDDYGAVATVGIGQSSEKAGFIIRLNEWDSKDIDADRFIDMTKAKNGVLDVYLLEGDENIYYSKSDVNLSPKFLSAYFTSNTEISFKSSEMLSASTDKADSYKLTDSDGKTYKIAAVKLGDGETTQNGTITLSDKCDFSKSYTLGKDGYTSVAVSLSNVFSTEEFENAFTYDGNDLGATYSKESTTFKVWAPTAEKVALNLYSTGSGDTLTKSVDMNKEEKGVWSYTESGDLNGNYYTYSVTVSGKTQEAVDLYARTAGVNGDRGMVVDLAATDPDGWKDDVKPESVNYTDSIIYELHVRDLSTDASSGIKDEYKGKFLAFTQTGTKNSSGMATGIDHIKELGATHIHLLPVFDYSSVDESKLENNSFNWGYDPKNYNVPEGSYSTDPTKGEVRVNEFKQMVQSIHKNGLRVIMDVVYNHTSATEDSNFNKTVPDYYYRKNGDSFSNASGCGNETASERAMMRKYIVDSVVYWATEYHVDGFRFDLMGIHDIETMNAVREALNKVDPSILIYGEGWTASTSPLAESLRAVKSNTYKLNEIAAFSDDIRDGIKGNVFNANDKGFVSGKNGVEESIKFGIVASTKHDQIDYTMVNYSSKEWAASPSQTINYVSAHDNLTLWDKLATSNADDDVDTRIKMNKLSAAIILTSQGIPFFQAGEEFLRSKPNESGTGFDENSYKSSDAVNSLKWDTLTENADVYNYYKGLISFRKAHPALRMTTTEDINKNLRFESTDKENVVAYTIKNKPNNESAEMIYVAFNANREPVELTLPAEGRWSVYVNGEKAGTEVIDTVNGKTVTVAAVSGTVLVYEGTASAAAATSNIALYCGIAVIAILILVLLIIVFKRSRQTA